MKPAFGNPPPPPNPNPIIPQSSEALPITKTLLTPIPTMTASSLNLLPLHGASVSLSTHCTGRVRGPEASPPAIVNTSPPPPKHTHTHFLFGESGPLPTTVSLQQQQQHPVSTVAVTSQSASTSTHSTGRVGGPEAGQAAIDPPPPPPPPAPGRVSHQPRPVSSSSGWTRYSYNPPLPPSHPLQEIKGP